MAYSPLDLMMNKNEKITQRSYSSLTLDKPVTTQLLSRGLSLCVRILCYIIGNSCRSLLCYRWHFFLSYMHWYGILCQESGCIASPLVVVLKKFISLDTAWIHGKRKHAKTQVSFANICISMVLNQQLDNNFIINIKYFSYETEGKSMSHLCLIKRAQTIYQPPNTILTCGFIYVPMRYINLYIVLKNSLQASMFPA